MKMELLRLRSAVLGAAFLLSFLPEGTHRFLIMTKAHRPGDRESLAQRFVRLYGHLLSDISVLELAQDGTLNWRRKASFAFD